MSEESTPPQVSVQDFLWYMICPCCCSNPMDSFAPDAVKLTPEEAKTYVDQMQGMTLFVKKTNLLIYICYYVLFIFQAYGK